MTSKHLWYITQETDGKEKEQEEVVYSVHNTITGRTVTLRWSKGLWYVVLECATFSFNTFESAKRGAWIMAGMHR